MLTPANPTAEQPTAAENQNTPLTELAGYLRRARRVLAMCHIHPDGDAIGSLLALGWLLKALPEPPAVILACADPVPPVLQFLPGADEVITEPPAGPWDAIVSLDASDAARLGSIYRPALYPPAPIIVLDHHITNLRFGTLNYVDPTAAATAQLVLRLADALGITVGAEVALCLMTGLVTDTLAFRTSNVDAAVLADASRLAGYGISIAELVERTLSDQPVAILRLWGLALSDLRLEDKVVWSVLTREMRATAGVTSEEDGKLVSQLINTAEARAAVLFNEQPDGEVEVDLRARPGYDIAQVALSLGGGGHPQAAGCTLTGTWMEVKERVLPLVSAAVADRLSH
jgi:bifunctional oligoribonuclease and PAP phosphatase NrnA